MRTLTILFASCVLVWACGDSGSPSSSTAGERNDGDPREPAPGDGANKDEKPGEPSPDHSAAFDIVLNEVKAVGSDEWIELANRGQVEIEIGDYFVADSDKDTRQPKKNDAMRFPTGTKLKPQERIVILTSKRSGTVGPHPKASCLPDGPDTCFYASFGVSASDGESIHLLAPDGNVIWSTAIPESPGADAGGAVDETLCRLPDMTGELQKCTPTPGEPNRGL